MKHCAQNTLKRWTPATAQNGHLPRGRGITSWQVALLRCSQSPAFKSLISALQAANAPTTTKISGRRSLRSQTHLLPGALPCLMQWQLHLFHTVPEPTLHIRMTALHAVLPKKSSATVVVCIPVPKMTQSIARLTAVLAADYAFSAALPTY